MRPKSRDSVHICSEPLKSSKLAVHVALRACLEGSSVVLLLTGTPPYRAFLSVPPSPGGSTGIPANLSQLRGVSIGRNSAVKFCLKRHNRERQREPAFPLVLSRFLLPSCIAQLLT